MTTERSPAFDAVRVRSAFLVGVLARLGVVGFALVQTRFGLRALCVVLLLLFLSGRLGRLTTGLFDGRLLWVARLHGVSPACMPAKAPVPSTAMRVPAAGCSGAQCHIACGGPRMKRLCAVFIVSAVLWGAAAAQAASLTRDQALKALDHPDAAARIEGIERLGAIGRAADAEKLMRRLGDADDDVRAAATDAIWLIWSRSGDAAIDKLFARGVEHMQGQMFDDALTVFSQIVARRPAFAEGWNKRATVYFLLGEYEKSLQDCDEVFKRNPNHFGALAGAGQIHLHLGHLPEALQYFQRALKVNPNLDGIRQAIPLIEQRLRDKERSTT